MEKNGTKIYKHLYRIFRVIARIIIALLQIKYTDIYLLILYIYFKEYYFQKEFLFKKFYLKNSIPVRGTCWDCWSISEKFEVQGINVSPRMQTVALNEIRARNPIVKYRHYTCLGRTNLSSLQTTTYFLVSVDYFYSTYYIVDSYLSYDRNSTRKWNRNKTRCFNIAFHISFFFHFFSRSSYMAVKWSSRKGLRFPIRYSWDSCQDRCNKKRWKKW